MPYAYYTITQIIIVVIHVGFLGNQSQDKNNQNKSLYYYISIVTIEFLIFFFRKMHIHFISNNNSAN